jgi:hypothetical protein
MLFAERRLRCLSPRLRLRRELECPPPRPFGVPHVSPHEFAGRIDCKDPTIMQSASRLLGARSFFMVGAWALAAPGSAQINWSTPGSALHAPAGAAQNVAVPVNLHRAASASECSQHGSVDCSQLANPTYAMLVWSADAAATGFNVYRTDGASPQPVGNVMRQPASNNLMAAARGTLVPTAFGIVNVVAGACYAVSEINGNLEGPRSTPWCLTGPNPANALVSNTFAARTDSGSTLAGAGGTAAARNPFAGGAIGGATTGGTTSAWHPVSDGKPAVVPLPAAAPTNLHRTGDIAECAAHAADNGVLCTQLSDPNYVLLVWNVVKGATGYNLYHADTGSNSAAGIVRLAADGSLATAFSYTNVTVGSCFTVSEITNNVEGLRSAPWCLQKTFDDLGSTRSATKSVIAASTPVIPTNLKSTSSVDECTQHQGNLICAALQGGAQTITVLVWQGEKGAQKYTVYRIGSTSKLTDAVPLGSNTGTFDGVVPTAFSLDKVTAGMCYGVTETLDARESPLSARFCPTTSSARTITLAPLHVQSYVQESDGKCSAYTVLAQFQGQPGQGSQNGLIVGYNSVSTPCSGDFNSTGFYSANTFSRGAVFFDVTSVTGKNVLRALLVLPVVSAITPDKSVAASCATTVNNGSDQWWLNQSDPLALGSPSLDATPLAGEVDVTSLVKAWVMGSARGGADNDGFVLTGATENLSTMTGACLTTYGNATLVVTTQ